MTKPTPKERVLKRWPTALLGYVSPRDSHRMVYSPVRFPPSKAIYYVPLGTGPTPAAAWRNAAERMK